MSSIVLPCLGLAPDQHAMAAPKGAMAVADNVVCDLPGIVRGRTSFEMHTNKSTAYEPRSMHVWNGTPIVVSKDSTTWRIESTAGTYTGNAEPVSFNDRETSFAEARESLYYCTSTGVRAIKAVGDSATVSAGNDLASAISPRRGVLFAQVTVPADPGWVAAWCWVVKRTDSNGYIRRSPPSQRWVHAENTATTPPNFPILIAAASGANLQFGFPTGTLQAGDEVEFYRTVIVTTATGTPASQMFLAFVYTITAADVAALAFPADSGVTIRDNCTDDQLGEELYTNLSREGPLAAKTTPPVAQEAALWGGCMWYGRTKERHRLVVTLLGVGQDNATAALRPAMTANTIGRLDNTTAAAITGDYTNTSPTILNVTDVTGVEVGDYITDGTTDATEAAGTQVPADTQVLSISGAGPYTVTMTKNATATAVGAGVRFYSKVTIDSVDFRAEQFTRLGPNGAGFTSYKAFGTGWTYADQASRAERSAAELAKAINAAQAGGLVTVRAYAIPGSGQLIIERTTPAGAAFSLVSAKTAAWLPRAGAALTSTQEDRPNRVFFSLPDEPEAVPLVNFIDVGSQLHPIQRLLALTDALLVWKTDGLYRITGSYGATGRAGWSVDCIDSDPGIRLVRPEDVDVMEGEAYAWTNRGFVVANESGVREVLSSGKIDTELAPIRSAMLASSSLHGSHVVCHANQRLVLLSVPSSSGSLDCTATSVYAFSLLTGAWTRWPSIWWRCADYDPSTNRVYAAVNNSLDELEWEVRYSLNASRGHDRRYDGVAMTESATSLTVTITNAQRGDWVPTAGDWIRWKVSAGDVYRRVLTATATGSGNYSFTLDDYPPSDFASASSVDVFVGAPVTLEWLPCAMGTNGYSLGVWREFTFQMNQEAEEFVTSPNARFSLSVRSDGLVTLPEVVGTPVRSLMRTRPYRMGWPRDAARRPVVAPRLSFSEVNWPWRLVSVALIGELGSEKVRQ